MKISFAGCGFLGVYHIGVSKCLVEKAPEFVDSLEGYYGASAGSLVAVMLCCRVGQDGGPRFAKKMSNLIRESYLGPFSATFDPSSLIVRDLGRYLPPDAHKRCSGKVKISLTNCSTWPWSNWKVSEFNTRRELINAVVASCFIPVWSGWTLPKFRGKKVCDGGFTNNLPGYNDPDVITVCPFSGESDICPQDPCQLEQSSFLTNTPFRLSTGNLQRLKESLFPPKWEKLEQLMAQGYQDAYMFLRSRGIVSKAIDRGLSAVDGPSDGDDNSISHTLYQVLYELPLINRTVDDSVNQLPSVPPARPIVFKSITEQSLWYRLLSLTPAHVYILWCRCASLLGSISSWKLALLIRLMNLLRFAMKEAGILNKNNKLLLLTDSQHTSVITTYTIVPISSLQ